MSRKPEIGDLWSYNIDTNNTVYLILKEEEAATLPTDNLYRTLFTVLDLVKNESFSVVETSFRNERWVKQA
jgi:hypothetical protein